jgi:hypothetical protein
VNPYRNYPLKTKRLVIGQVTICRGCCCGNTDRGLPEVPVEWLKNEWRKGTAEASPADNQWLCRAMRRAECGCNFNRNRDGVAREH